eukprot:5379687-Pleurochrysis_carterae.AAC.2
MNLTVMLPLPSSGRRQGGEAQPEAHAGEAGGRGEGVACSVCGRACVCPPRRGGVRGGGGGVRAAAAATRRGAREARARAGDGGLSRSCKRSVGSAGERLQLPSIRSAHALSTSASMLGSWMLRVTEEARSEIDGDGTTEPHIDEAALLERRTELLIRMDELSRREKELKAAASKRGSSQKAVSKSLSEGSSTRKKQAEMLGMGSKKSRNQKAGRRKENHGSTALGVLAAAEAASVQRTAATDANGATIRKVVGTWKLLCPLAPSVCCNAHRFLLSARRVSRTGLRVDRPEESVRLGGEAHSHRRAAQTRGGRAQGRGPRAREGALRSGCAHGAAQASARGREQRRAGRGCEPVPALASAAWFVLQLQT